MTDEALWYKDAIIYQLHVKAFFDSDNSGIGDVAGLTTKLDYLQDLGVTALWLMPFYPSPLRDDGYDISDYTSVHPDYGTMRDFRRLVREAHRRNLKIITELVINHTSDAHPWFQRARRSARGSVYRNYYVWSDTDQKYQGTRIIFTDTEKSNWAWDPVAQQYYWHRFFSHQPDLNYANPRVLDEVIRIMRFWLDAGVDGLRLDAVPYLCEREGTNNENLPETHAILKKIRRQLDSSHANRMLLAEANQWPEDVLPYFGDGDECHMAFHFPLMPRLYMAIAQEERHPITDIMRQTPEIPENCQWAIFLRNHDELTLEMVSSRERDYLWNFYAADSRMRINLGIRRRLATLVEGSRPKIELLNSLLMSMPGTPVIYYGDEIGMGDNIYLGDRNAVRTPMQWTPDRNGGFSRADPARLYLPCIMDPVYGYQALNVEAQARRPSSLLNWMKRIISVRKAHQAFGRGTIRFLHPGNRKVLVYVREYGDDVILCVANLSRASQPVELRMPEYAGRVPIEMIGRSAFPPIGELPYFISLPAYGFYWFLLTTEVNAPSWHEPFAPALPEFLTLVTPQGYQSLQSGHARRLLEQTILPEFLARQRWFQYAEHADWIERVTLDRAVELPDGDGGWMISTWQVRLKDGTEHTYFLPLAIAWERGGEDALAPHVAYALGRVRKVAQVGGLYDALFDENFCRTVIAYMRQGHETQTPSGEKIRFVPTSRMAELPESPEPEPVQRLGEEQINTSMRIGADKMLKAFRSLRQGPHPEVEVAHYLTEVARYPNTPRLYGWMELLNAEGVSTVLAMLQERVVNQGDGWTYTLEYLGRFLDDVALRAEADEPITEPHAAFAQFMRKLGVRTAELHQAFCRPTDDPNFQLEPVTPDDLAALVHGVRDRAAAAFEALRKLEQTELPEEIRRDVDKVLAIREGVEKSIDVLTPAGYDGMKSRY
ncbi:MAG TPA: maltose alpha-D-glucosyltransferase, partial [Phycisphaerae bacterium]|nr:maltose alpha-D-glucosyltransferase [Phycisphaerae bacterium]